MDPKGFQKLSKQYLTSNNFCVKHVKMFNIECVLRLRISGHAFKFEGDCRFDHTYSIARKLGSDLNLAVGLPTAKLKSAKISSRI